MHRQILGVCTSVTQVKAVLCQPRWPTCSRKRSALRTCLLCRFMYSDRASSLIHSIGLPVLSVPHRASSSSMPRPRDVPCVYNKCPEVPLGYSELDTAAAAPVALLLRTLLQQLPPQAFEEDIRLHRKLWRAERSVCERPL